MGLQDGDSVLRVDNLVVTYILSNIVDVHFSDSFNYHEGFMNTSYFISKFEQFEREKAWDELFHEINVLSDEQEKHLGLSYEVSNSFDNAEKNRYRNVLPYDQNRVTLKLASQVKSDYINASPLYVPFTQHNYILTQGPLPNTSDDFWQMVYEQKAKIVIMLSKIMEKNFIKCHPYFPNKDEPIGKFESCQCELLSEDVKPHYVVRQIRLTFNGPTTKPNSAATSDNENPADENISAAETGTNNQDSRVIYHFQFMTWPDFGVPEHTDHFLEFLTHIRQTNNQFVAEELSLKTECDKAVMGSPVISPIVCHCSAGIGRTGAFVLIDSVLNILEQNDRKNLPRNSAEPETVAVNNVSENKTQPITVTAVDAVNNSTADVNNSSSKLTVEVDDSTQLKKLKSELSTTTVASSSSKVLPIINTKELRVELFETEQKSPTGAASTTSVICTNSAAASPCSIADNEVLTSLIDLVVFMRRSRMGLIQTPQQLRFCLKAIVDWINSNRQTVDDNNDDNNSNSNNIISNSSSSNSNNNDNDNNKK